ncbi:helix-turn-helix domain-containing protein [Alicyclobacillus fastidiosus]|uniref:Helix-turn-helix domain-containing protein n=1 Tax=Alicyclobacillus fastidiosus TaxID=392011 RepID=A0ABY6ZHZ3_9BACL|nr:ArsR family transcriptional regulator [Alicyclobacillus fastidiosus]WAH42466.1 helix-turn-helix domain-containing protein [Alicyclobacillus fastidiosus]WAH42497.1 helix-turn-helix domain-containing protein [Alicyclobacillus fastidiosus]
MPHTMLALQQDKQHNEHIADGVKSSELIRLVTKGSALQPHPGVNTLWLIPQSAYRPFTIVNYLPHCLVYYYPVADEFLPGGIAQTQMMQVAALHKALGDAQRIRLLTLVRHSAKSLGELTNTLNATKSNVHHHLTLLRTVGLVQVEDGVYSINPTNCSVIHKEPIRDFPDSDFHWCIISGLECTVGHAASTVDSRSVAWA